jgi:hypothetical protein
VCDLFPGLYFKVWGGFFVPGYFSRKDNLKADEKNPYSRGPGLSNFMLCGCVCAGRQMCVLKSYPYNDSVCVCVCVCLCV